jgi:hypothetical protein
MGSVKANVAALVSGCLGLTVGFVTGRTSFDSPAVETQLATLALNAQGGVSVLSQINDEASNIAPAPQNPYVCRVISPTFPPQDIGVWDPLKSVDDEYSQRRSPGKND